MDLVTIAPAPQLKILSILPASSSISPDAEIVGFLRLSDAILVARLASLTPHPLSKSYYKKVGYYLILLDTTLNTKKQKEKKEILLY
jgi:hypothetical protein